VCLRDVDFRDEILVAGENDHQKQIADKDDVNKLQDRDHHELRGERIEMFQHVPELLKELQADDGKRQDKAEVEGCQNPPTGVDPSFKDVLECVEHMIRSCHHPPSFWK